MKNNLYDVAIVGSGPSGVHVAYPLVKAGLRVAIIDGGLDSNRQDDQPANTKGDVKKSNPYDLLAKSGYVFNKTYQLLKIKSNIEIIQSLAKGGLSEIWHGICDFFTPEELEAIGLPPEQIQKEYIEIAHRIKLKLHPHLDLHGKLILKAAGDQVYRLPIAYPYRTSKVIESLRRHKNFTYIHDQLVCGIKEKTKYVEIESVSIENQKKTYVRSRYLVLAAGAVNTTRVLLRSFELYNYNVPFLTKGHTMFVCLHLQTLIKRRHSNVASPGQVSLICNDLDRGLNSFFVQFYRCNLLAQDMALQYIPLPKPLASLLFSIIAPYLVIVDIRFPTSNSNKSFCRLKKSKNNTDDILEISSGRTDKEIVKHKEELEKISKQIWSFGLLPLKTITSDVTSHYAGGVPFQTQPGKLSTDANGKLHQARRIYIADSSTWRALPAKPPTLTIMASARRVGKNVLKNFK